MTRGVQALIFTDCVTYGTVWQRSAGAYRMATELRNMGLSVQVVDYFSFITLEGYAVLASLVNKFVGTDTLFVGFSTTFMSVNWANTHLKDLSAVNKKVSHLQAHRVGNIYACDEQLLTELKAHIKTRNPRVDFVAAGARSGDGDVFSDVRVIGYGEQHFREYIEWKRGKKPLYIHTKDVDGTTLINSNPKAEGFDFANSTITWSPEDCVQPGETLPIEISRGCIFKCKFCSYPLNGKSKIDYLKEASVLRSEFLRNYLLFGTTRYVFADDTYNDSTFKLEWLQGIKDSLPFKLEFVTYLRLDLIAAHREQIGLLEENGLIGGFFGIESLHHQAAKAIGKGMAPDKLIDVLHELRSTWGHRITTMAGFILGLPHDTDTTMTSWCEQIVDHRFPLHTFEVSPLGIKNPKDKRPYTFYSDLDKNAERYGYVFKNNSWVNDKYGTSYEKCNKLGATISKYAQETGRLTISPHVMPSVMAHGFSALDLIKLGRQDTLHASSLYNKVYMQYINYLTAIFKVGTE